MVDDVLLRLLFGVLVPFVLRADEFKLRSASREADDTFEKVADFRIWLEREDEFSAESSRDAILSVIPA